MFAIADVSGVGFILIISFLLIKIKSGDLNTFLSNM